MNESEIKKLLRENLELSQENNKMLRKMNRARIFGTVFWVVKWVVIIGLSYGAYVYIQPYIEKMIGAAESISTGVGKIGDVGETLPLNLIDRIKDLSN
ncbi:TPA: hypothetical protein DEW47_02570 [Patescibacteria group bacterium]|nr:MAG: hypothetical protein UT71_C0004G0025 [Parcubacteria group bacterium GW2011_GWF2_40_10]KKR47206.1 MAG: hypothetical protein UT83_C0012G0007 [Parcubacteria group bacterium GW2011_GWA2_40_143]KKR60171.1 MAG: hypothetical protein UT97_C0004G0040 [Parcubacteria group bacterium GW2011_GWC2_40_31]KKR74831.1 MAG: hypothetical protein UU18_C0018G0002 [Parcubacteria group bacterium GW2011_GWB2_40_8]KKR76270.1 MAG: hypothetical protein UU20_C0029G0012 [Parcubacteria group bacterium GW2011_GWE2_40_